MSTTSTMSIVFVDTGLDALWALYVLFAVGISALLFLKAFTLGSRFFQDENLKV